MKKEQIFKFLATSLVAGQVFFSSHLVLAEEASSQLLEELRQSRQDLDQENAQLESEIKNSKDEMSNLSQEKADLEADIQAIQANVDRLIAEIDQRQEEIQDKEDQIDQLHKEIGELTELIDRRTEKVADQARSVQKTGDVTSIVNALLSSDTVADLLNRVHFISEIISSNRSIISDQKADHDRLKASEEKLKDEEAKLKATKSDLEVAQNNLVNQRLALESQVSQVAQVYDLSQKDLASLEAKKDEIARQTSHLDQQVKDEQERLEEERLEQERLARKEAERQRQQAEEAERIRQAEALAKEEAEVRAKEEAEAHAKAQESQQDQAKEVEREIEEENRDLELNERDNQQPAQVESSQSSQSQPSQSSASTTVQVSSSLNPSSWIRPASGRMTSGFGYRLHPIKGYRKLHEGIDIAGSGPVRASKAGRVIAASYTGGLGYHVRIDHGNGLTSVYGHLQPSLAVAPGQTVSQGQVLGQMGSSGSSTGVHLHFEIRQNGRPVNPMNYLY
ncbi:Stage II sporulation protein Q [Alloiococcus otitis]|mgnify:CR=1 FL=1|uniref:Uncharacterized protein n=1 Tax=Alloiococcus otitis ATCC 51267 TaxID=883081 RepID=K9E8V8_9LACT|nr:M23 family metallopeptidase [Alloiococcus otitis]EKU93118.1 hypothetical protein HMPREF9698_01195 [Alloiococcus otitis ATCC 51267]SUU80752.1 Stage II sporulation protein Q [Alloiococcus otitis]